MLTKKQIEYYNENGFVIPNFSLADDKLAELRKAQLRFVEKYPKFRDYCPNLLAYDLHFLNYLKINDILDMVEQILGKNFALWNASLFSKPKKNGLKTPWHQDGEYWPIRPLETCTVWLAIDDANVSNGCLKYIPGSHKKKTLLKHHTSNEKEITLNQELSSENYNEDDAYYLELKAGQIALHDVRIIHGSDENLSDKPRRGMTMRYMPTSSLFDRKLADELTLKTNLVHSDRTLFLMRGVDKNGGNDFLVRN